jgi:hypothetical protein
LNRAALSSRELDRGGVMGRVGSGDLKLKDAAVTLELSYRQAERLRRRYRQVGTKGLQIRNAGRASSRSKPVKFCRRDLCLIGKKFPNSPAEIPPPGRLPRPSATLRLPPVRCPDSERHRQNQKSWRTLRDCHMCSAGPMSKPS